MSLIPALSFHFIKRASTRSVPSIEEANASEPCLSGPVGDLTPREPGFFRWKHRGLRALAILLLASSGAWAQGVFSAPQPVGVTTAPQTVTVSATTAGTVNQVKVLTSGASGLDFAPGSGSTCAPTVTLAAGGTCTESVTFTPASPGLRVGAVVLLDVNNLVLGMSYLSGTGTGGLGVLVPGNVITVAGVYRSFGPAEDNILATLSNLDEPSGVALDGAGNLYIADSGPNHNRIRKVAPPVPPATAGIISTVAGVGAADEYGDGGPALKAALSSPSGVALDGAGNLFIADTGNNEIRRVDAFTGIITTVAGSLLQGNSGDNGPATAARLNQPQSVVVDQFGNLFIADTFNQLIRRVDAVTGFITTVAGNGLEKAGGLGTGTFSGDGGPANAAGLGQPFAVAFDPQGDMYIADSANNRIRKVTAVNGVLTPTSIITTFAGTGAPAYTGDNGPATLATLNSPWGVVVDAAGNVYIADTQNNAIRKVNAGTGVISTLVVNGGGSALSPGPAGQLAGVPIFAPIGLLLDGNGNLYYADYFYMLLQEIESDKAVLNFTKTPVRQGMQSLPQQQTVENDGTAPLDLTNFPPVSNAAWDPATTTCSLKNPLPADANCAVGVIFAPSLAITFPPGVAQLPTFGEIDVEGNGDGYPQDKANFPLDIILAGTATPVNSTTTVLKSSINPSVFGQTVVFTATVTSGATAGIPAGTITFDDGGTILKTVTLDATGVAAYSISTLAVSDHVITASFVSAANANFLPSSGSLTQVVNEVSKTVLVSSVNPSTLGQSVTFTGTVTILGGGGVAPDEGQMIFTDGTTGATLGTVILNAAGVASIPVSNLTVGIHAITATWGADNPDHILGSTSNTVQQDVQAQTSLVLLPLPNPNPSTYGLPVTLSATLTTTGPIAPTGSIAFLDGPTQIGKGPLAPNGIATFTTSALTAGTHPITASYVGDVNNTPALSPPVSEVVNKTQTSTTLVSAPTIGIAGKPVVLTATVQVVAGLGAITGTVTFTENGNILAPPTALSPSGQAVISVNLPLGPHIVIATYSGDANDNISSGTLNLNVVQATTQTLLTTSGSPSVVLTPVTFTAKVTGNGGTPTGTVTFLSDGTAIGTGTLDGTGTATLTYSSLTAGSHVITATYSGDANDASNTSNAVTQQVGTIPTVTDLAASTTTGATPQLILVAAVLNNPTVGLGVTLPIPTGSVTFSNGNTVVGVVPLDASGVATLTPDLPTGKYNIVATYSGDPIHSPSTSAVVAVSTPAAGFNLVVTPASVTVVTTHSTTVNVAISSVDSFTDTIGLAACRG